MSFYAVPEVNRLIKILSNHHCRDEPHLHLDVRIQLEIWWNDQSILRIVAMQRYWSSNYNV